MSDGRRWFAGKPSSNWVRTSLLREKNAGYRQSQWRNAPSSVAALSTNRCRYVARRHAQSSVFEYATEWLGHQNAFAIDPENLPLQAGPFYTSSDKSALPGALRDTAPDRWGGGYRLL
ncbi:MAG TPA: hypothetical protein ENI74_09585 [Gammaproteobacteria bacterium]|nr:hypothetical protein [Gammaproteobacteria bacterium]